MLSEKTTGIDQLSQRLKEMRVPDGLMEHISFNHHGRQFALAVLFAAMYRLLGPASARSGTPAHDRCIPLLLNWILPPKNSTHTGRPSYLSGDSAFPVQGSVQQKQPGAAAAYCSMIQNVCGLPQTFDQMVLEANGHRLSPEDFVRSSLTEKTQSFSLQHADMIIRSVLLGVEGRCLQRIGFLKGKRPDRLFIPVWFYESDMVCTVGLFVAELLVEKDGYSGPDDPLIKADFIPYDDMMRCSIPQHSLICFNNLDWETPEESLA